MLPLTACSGSGLITTISNDDNASDANNDDNANGANNGNSGDSANGANMGGNDWDDKSTNHENESVDNGTHNEPHPNRLVLNY